MLVICVPSGDEWKTDFAISYGRLIRNLTKAEVPHGLVNVRTSDIHVSRNKCVDQALEAGATELLWLDSDLKFPGDVYDRLHKENKDFIGATYAKRDLTGQLTHIERAENTGADVEEVYALAGGCNLVKADVYKKVEWPWYAQIVDVPNRTLKGEDYTFCIQARRAGYSIWLHRPVSLELLHIGSAGIRIDGFPPIECPEGAKGYTPFTKIHVRVSETP